MKTIKLLFLMIVTALLVSCNGNAGRKANKTMDKETMVLTDKEKDTDADFVKEAARGGMMEVELGNYAEQNAQHPRVKNFGAMMVRDHSRANEELKSIASSKNFAIPASVEEDHKGKMNDLQKKTGADFDKDYISSMVDDHQKDIDAFKKEAEDGRDPDLKSFAVKSLPILETHLDSAKNIKGALK
jgi:putative membrane protein